MDMESEIIKTIKSYKGFYFIDDILCFFDKSNKLADEYENYIDDVYSVFLKDAFTRGEPTAVFNEFESENCKQWLDKQMLSRKAILCFPLQSGVRLYAFQSEKFLNYKLSNNSSYQKLKAVVANLKVDEKENF